MTSYLEDLDPVPSFQPEIGHIEPWSLARQLCHIQCNPPGDAIPHHVPFTPSAQAIHALEPQGLWKKSSEDPECRFQSRIFGNCDKTNEDFYEENEFKCRIEIYA